MPFPVRRRAQSAGDAVRAAEEIGYPVAVKGLSDTILHKAAAGLAHLPLFTSAEVEMAFQACQDVLVEQERESMNVIVESCVDTRGGAELMVAGHCDVEMGPVLVVGAGGALAEATDTASITALALTARAADRVIETSPFLRRLEHAQGRILDFPALRAFLVSFSLAAHGLLDQFETIEINPVALLRSGQGCVALDAVAAPFGRLV